MDMGSFSQFGVNPAAFRGNVRFSGYRPVGAGPMGAGPLNTGKVQLYVPGHWTPDNEFQFQVSAKVIEPDRSQSEIPFTRKGAYWYANRSIPVGSSYQINIREQYGKQPVVHLDNGHVHEIGPEQYNLVSPYENSAPQKACNLADIFLDSLLSRDKLVALLEKRGQKNLAQTVRNHFNQFGGNEQGLQELLPVLQAAGFTGILLKPFIGGDNLSSHRYWTVDPYVLNNSFSSKTAFRSFVVDAMRHGMKVFSDGAFINLGLNSPQMMSNMYHRYRSPYWNWFMYEHQAPGTRAANLYPREAHEKHLIGRLPLTPELEPDLTRVAIRVVNDPQAPHYEVDKPVYVEFYDPQTQTLQGDSAVNQPVMTCNDDSLPNYRFQVSPEELRQKRAKLAQIKDPLEQRRLFLEWDSFAMVAGSHDGMPIKWDGQIDVALVNLKNPEVQDYIVGAIEYWTRYVRDTYIAEITQALAKAKAANPNGKATDWIEAITQSDAQQKVLLPPVLFPKVETLTEGQCQFSMKAGQIRAEEEDPAKALTHLLRKSYPLGAIEFPTHFKAITAHPDLTARLAQETLPFWARFLGILTTPFLGPFRRVPVIDFFFKQFEDLIRPRSFDGLLENKWSEVFDRLSPADRDKLKVQSVQDFLVEPLGEALNLLLFTNQTQSDTPSVTEGFYKTVPGFIHKADPETGKNLLIRFMKKRLASLDTQALAQVISSRLNGIEPSLLGLARGIVEKREFGMNWRMDAAKDAGNMDRVRDIRNPEARSKAFEQEMEFVAAFWRKATQRIRNVFGKAGIIAELTSFEMLAKPEVAQASMEKLLDGGIFTGTPNMKYMYDAPMRLVHYAPKPHEFGLSQMSIPDFLKGLKAMSQEVPTHALRHYQNLTSSHDYPNTAHVLLTNPALATMDYLNWWGVKDDFNEACQELLTKPGFAEDRQQLEKMGISNLAVTLDVLMQRINSPEIRAKLSRPVQEYYSENDKKDVNGYGQEVWAGPTPPEIKAAFVEEVFDLIPHAELNNIPTPYIEEQLAKRIKARIMEPSPAKAMRAVISNTVIRLDWAGVARRLGCSQDKLRELRNRFEVQVHAGINQAIDEAGAQFGYQPLEIALENVFRFFNAGWASDLSEAETAPGFGTPPALDNPGRIETAIKEQMYQQAIEPVLDKLLRIIALQVAAPGNPSIYLPDWFAQTGSELVKNMYVQNRNVVDYSQVEPKTGPDAQLLDRPYLREFQRKASAILKWRTETPVLKDVLAANGLLIPKASSSDAVVPIIRDDGENQVIFLVSTGKPREMRWNNKVGGKEDNKEGNPSLYAEISQENPVGAFHSFKLDVSNLNLTPHLTRYKDSVTGEEFMVNAQGIVVKASNPSEGIDMTLPYRVLVRQPLLAPSLT